MLILFFDCCQEIIVSQIAQEFISIVILEYITGIFSPL